MIEQYSGRVIRLAPAPRGVGQGMCGMWIRTTQGVDYIFVREDTSRAHQDHIIAHELGHILRDHRGGLSFSAVNPVTTRLAPTLDPEIVRMMLGRSSYEDSDEREAELIGTYLQRRIHHTAGRRVWNHDRVTATLLRQM
ncbi:hypothetical protein [Frankia sp. R82]|uniref:hypothetical protein n=1 Tax=Frankia sp. R82 TaxID=2950553 RepID=UPI00204303E0|nr:hypothetical protein [Frankia sp. R82]MCM3882288.1 hypothetical protein [Frankia sp. R82]